MNDTICRIFHDLFGVEPERCTDGLSMQDVEGWDSVRHFTLVLTLEEAFGVFFAPEDIPTMTSVAGIKAALERRRGARAGG